MDCINRNCNISGDERMVFCWLCLGNYHLKCSGLKARDADALSDKAKNIQWTCPSCRVIGIEFYNFFKSYKAEFEEIKKDFSALQGKLSKYGELFSKFSNLDNFTASPKPKRKRTAKPSSSPPKDLNVAAVNNIQCAVTESSIQKQNPYPDQIPTPVSPKQITVTPSPTLNTVTYANVVLDQNSNIAPANLLVVPPKSVTVTPITNTHTPEITPLPSTSSNVSTNMNASNQPINPFSAVSTPKPLKTIPPRKTIFATRFALDTTVNDVDYHIKSNLGMELYNDVQIFKINARNRASFKIIVPESIFDRLVHPKFWPENTIVRQFVYHEDNNVTLPKAADNIPKN